MNAQTTPGAQLKLSMFLNQTGSVPVSVTGVSPLTLSATLDPGFYVAKVEYLGACSQPFFGAVLCPTAPFTFQLGLSAPAFVGGVDTGGYLGPGVTGYGAFYISQAQSVSIKLFGRTTYQGTAGYAAAGSMILTLKDANRNVLQVVQP